MIGLIIILSVLSIMALFAFGYLIYELIDTVFSNGLDKVDVFFIVGIIAVIIGIVLMSLGI